MALTRRRQYHGALTALVFFGSPQATSCLNGAAPQLQTFNGWKVFEVITEGNNPSSNWPLPGTLDGTGAYLASDNELRIQVNHELATAATISEVALHVPSLKTAISNMIGSGTLRGQKFMIGARRGYSRYTLDAGKTWKTDRGNFRRFCSAQSYSPRPRGFKDQLYITGEETGRNLQGRLVVIDSRTRDMYVLSGVTGSSGEGNPGFPFDSFENAAWIDTKENNHIALVLSADYGSESLMLYVGVRGKGTNGQDSNDILARNGLAYGSWFFLKGTFPNINQSSNGSFGTAKEGALTSSKLEDVDTNPSFPTRVVLGDQNSGVFVLDFSLKFSGNAFNRGQSSFSIKKIADHNPNNNLNGADNADWTAATTLRGKSYPEGIIYMNEDTDTGEIWQMTPDGDNKIRIGASKTGGESTGILDISELLNYAPGSIVLSNNFGSPEGDSRNLPSAMHILINPDATEADGVKPNLSPIKAPTLGPTRKPVQQPNPRPIAAPSPKPTRIPTAPPSGRPNPVPVSAPNPKPTRRPTFKPTRIPTSPPSGRPIPTPVALPVHLSTSQPVISPKAQTPVGTPDGPSRTFTPTATSISPPDEKPILVDAKPISPETNLFQTQELSPTAESNPLLNSSTVPQTEPADESKDADSIERKSFSPSPTTFGLAALVVVVLLGIVTIVVTTVHRKRTIATEKRHADLTFDTASTTVASDGGVEVNVDLTEASA